jgi:hypothetical protein
MLMSPDEYRTRAQECVQLAATAAEAQRPSLLQIAGAWLRLAEQAEAEERIMRGEAF